MAHRAPFGVFPVQRNVGYERVRLASDEDVKGIHFSKRSPTTPGHSDWHMAWTVAHIVVTLTALGISIATVAFALGLNCNTPECKSLIYITNTFSSTNKIGSLAGWAVATERAQFGEVVQYPADKDVFEFSHYFECMATARMADTVCPTTDPVPDYVTCLKNDTRTRTALTTCNAVSSSLSQPWPTAEEYLDCLFKFSVMRNSVSVRASKNVFRTCLSKTMWPFFEVQQGIDTPLFLGSFNWMMMLAVGMVCMTSFAVYTVSPWEMGMVEYGEATYYMRLGVLWTSVSTIWNALFFFWFIAVAFRDGTAYDQDAGLPTTTSTILVSIFVIGTCLFYFVTELLDSRIFKTYAVQVFRGSSAGGEKHAHIIHNHPHDPSSNEQHDGTMVVHHGHHHGHHKQKTASLLGGQMPNPAHESYSITPDDVAKYYTPPLLSAWADGYLADPCFILGMAGATGHLTTDQSWNLFFIMLIYRLLNMLIARYLYQCFMNNLSLSPKVNEAYHSIVPFHSKMWNLFYDIIQSKTTGRNRVAPANGDPPGDDAQTVPPPPPEPKHPAHYRATPHISIQVMALSTQIANLFLYAALSFIVFNKDIPLSEFEPFKLYFIFGFMIPEGIRILLHVLLQIWPPSPNGVPWFVLNTHFAMWIWDLLTRVIFVCFVIWANSSHYGTRSYLMEKNIALMDTYLTALGVN